MPKNDLNSWICFFRGIAARIQAQTPIWPQFSIPVNQKTRLGYAGGVPAQTLRCLSQKLCIKRSKWEERIVNRFKRKEFSDKGTQNLVSPVKRLRLVTYRVFGWFLLTPISVALFSLNSPWSWVVTTLTLAHLLQQLRVVNNWRRFNKSWRTTSLKIRPRYLNQ